LQLAHVVVADGPRVWSSARVLAVGRERQERHQHLRLHHFIERERAN
jgi:hypothetical protein